MYSIGFKNRRGFRIVVVGSYGGGAISSLCFCSVSVLFLFFNAANHDVTTKGPCILETMSTHTCENCQYGILCHQLTNALFLLKAKIDTHKASDAAIDEYYKILLELKQHGWDYPQNKDTCGFSNIKLDLKSITDRVIKVL